MNEVLIKVEGVSKKFAKDFKRSLYYGIKDVLTKIRGVNKTNITLRKSEFWSVKNVSFELKRGECLGLIGKNGAGKSTLLKMLNGLIAPDEGSITIKGKVAALIELGAGFNPILTGRENIYNNAAVIGFTKAEIDEKFDEIVAFSELGEFLDMPVQNYSSGMKVRLGFAVATMLEPDVLILDEVLAVGDAAFRAKCYNRIGALKQKAAVIFVSHSMQQVAQICTKVLVLKKGNIAWLGNVGKGIDVYNSENMTDEKENEAVTVIEAPALSANLEFETNEITYGDFLKVNLKVLLDAAIPSSIIRLVLYNAEGIVISEWNSKRNSHQIDLHQGENYIQLKIGPYLLRAGKYKVGFVLNDSTGVYVPFWSFKQHTIVVNGSYGGSCENQLSSAEILVLK
jgi:lipopolysaccharide transport system ATP-binding protein